MKPTLLILAAGSGSRYGGHKQLDSFGPNSETIMDYSIFDALKAGFGKIVFTIKKEFENEFEKRFSKLRTYVELAFAFQEVNLHIAGVGNIAQRAKPWGTVHAILSAAKFIETPFAVIN